MSINSNTAAPFPAHHHLYRPQQDTAGKPQEPKASALSFYHRFYLTTAFVP
jgi:hypothetical protein